MLRSLALPEESWLMSSRRKNAAQARAFHEVEDWLEAPMVGLSLVWIGLLAVELVWGAGPLVNGAATVIWIIFIVEFIFKFVLAPSRRRYLRANWLSLFALALPALRVFRIARVLKIFRAGRAVRGLALARVLAAFNRGLRSLQRTMGRFGAGYVALLTLMVTLLGSAGIFAFERADAGPGQIGSFGDALWFTAMLMTTSGSDYWPQSAEGRVLCFLLALYAFAVFGYVTATIAALLLGDRGSGAPTPSDAGLGEVRRELGLLRQEFKALVEHNAAQTSR